MNKKIIIVADYKFKKRWFTGLAYSYLRAFRTKEYDCELIEFEVNPHIYRLLERINHLKLNTYLNSKQKKIINYIISSDAEFVFVIKGYYLLPETINLLQDYGKKVFCFYPDNPLSEIKGSSNDCIKNSIRYYDCYFTWNKRLITHIKDAGCKNVFYLSFGADIDLLHPSKLDAKNEHSNEHYDVSFIGNVDEERTKFINSLSSHLDDNFSKIVFGSGWKNLDGFKVKGEAVGDEFINTVINSKINLNILRVQNKDSNNMRTFEIPAVGGFMLHEYSQETVEIFSPGMEADYFKSAEECADKIKYYLKNETLRHKISKAGHEKLFSAKHLYTDRVDEIWQKVTYLS